MMLERGKSDHFVLQERTIRINSNKEKIVVSAYVASGSHQIAWRDEHQTSVFVFGREYHAFAEDVF